MSRSITLYADVPGFSIKLSANSDQSPPWVQRLILIKDKKKVLHAQFDLARQSNISNQAANPFTPSASTSEHYRQGKNKGQTVGKKYFMKRLLQLPASKSLPPSSGFLPPASRSLPLGLGPASGSGF
ncbi:hypothetical protein DY000_02032112 [Brassica cretica]|uniref:Uncharacterized protein n=1 Tax=Brassica cretica TaxID=69181 RepID=A0ABQ7DND6_BRACR|nr:hypothetical protein DY000_02032112 [Brassica cretica]